MILKNLKTSDLEDFLFALKASNIGIWKYDADLNKVVLSSESKSIIGFEYDDNFGDNITDWNDRVHQHDQEKYFQDFQDFLNGVKPLYENMYRIKCKDGSYKWIKTIGKILKRDKNGKPKRIIGTHIDITKQKETEFKISNSLNLITGQNQKLKNFAHIVTHNLKSHSANFENLLIFYDEADSSTEKEELIKHLKTISDSLTKTMYNLNQIVSIQTSKNNQVQNLNVFEYINRTLKLLETEIKRTKAIIINSVNHTINLNFNPAYLESIFQNLLSNALKYRHPDRNPHIEFNSETTESNIIITVQDNGLGIDLDKYGNDIFNLYRTFHNNEDAEGVGLYLIKNQLEAFGGDIEVESKLGIGSRFIITLPDKNPEKYYSE